MVKSSIQRDRSARAEGWIIALYRRSRGRGHAAQLVVDYLARQKFRVIGVDGGIALLKLVKRELPALVMLKVGLPGEDGFALARWFRGIVGTSASSW